MQSSIVTRLQYITGSRARLGGSAAALVQQYLQQDGATRHAANLPPSQRYFYMQESHTVRGPIHITPDCGASTSLDTHSRAGQRGNVKKDEDDESVPSISQRHSAIQLRLGDAQMLVSTQQRDINNVNVSHPLFFAQTSPRGAGLCVPLVLALQRLRIRRLTELQGALVPLLLKGKHVLAHAETGTGKSFGIALAIANRILRDNVNYRLHTVILVPTEELALQYDKWLRYFGGASSQIVQAALESIPLERQLARLHNVAPHVLVGTPQRVAEITRLSPSILGEKLRRKVDCVVLDEADLVLAADIQYGQAERMSGANLVDRLYRSQRDEVPAQLVAASATMDGHTVQMLNHWTRNDKAVRLTTSFVEHTIPPTLQFYFFAATQRYPLPLCLELALRVIHRQTPQARVLLFTPEGDVAAVVALLRRDIAPKVDGFGTGSESGRCFAAPLHTSPEVSVSSSPSSSSSQSGRLVRQAGNVYVQDSSALARLNEGSLFVAVGSYEISRGLHVQGVTHVILYGDFPDSPTQFVHCAGRTGRMNRPGDVIVVFPPASGRRVQQACYSLELPFVAGKVSQLAELVDDTGGTNYASADTFSTLARHNAALREHPDADSMSAAEDNEHPMNE